MESKPIRCLIVCCLLLSPNLFALVGNADNGKQKAAKCAQCHGLDGNSVAASFPNLAGQQESYIARQLTEFRKGAKGQRNDPTMSGMAADLSDQDIADLAAYFSSQTMKGGQTPVNLLSLGEKLYRGGDLKNNIASCATCHELDGAGNNMAKIPRLAGQHPDYILTELKKFRTGERSNDPNGIMRDIAKRLTDEQIEAISQYVSGLHK